MPLLFPPLTRLSLWSSLRIGTLPPSFHDLPGKRSAPLGVLLRLDALSYDPICMRTLYNYLDFISPSGNVSLRTVSGILQDPVQLPRIGEVLKVVLGNAKC